MKRTPCKGQGCSKQVVWAVNENGKSIPLDPSAPVYTVTGVDPDGTVRCRRAGNGMVSHFATCTDAAQFSRGRR